jgi:DHA2 family multidrug resistance protein
MATLNRIVDVQAYTLAVNDLFLLSGVLFVSLLVLIWLAKPAKNVAVDAAGAH